MKGKWIAFFISYQKPHNSVSKQTIASWIVNVVKQADDDSNLKVNAHSTWAIDPSWALFKGASLSSLLEAADWSKDSVFKRFYNRQIDSHEWEFWDINKVKYPAGCRVSFHVCKYMYTVSED